MDRTEQQLEFFNQVVTEEIQKIADSLTTDYFRQAIELIHETEQKGGRLHISGIGKPHHVACYMASLFSSTGTPCYVLDGTEATHGSSGQVKPGDTVICISYYGNVPELIKTVDTLRRNKAHIISVTGFPQSYIARQSDVHLCCHVEQEGDSLNKPPRTSMLATLYMLMALSLMLQEEKGMTQQEYVCFHPSGELGKLSGEAV